MDENKELLTPDTDTENTENTEITDSAAEAAEPSFAEAEMAAEKAAAEADGDSPVLEEIPLVPGKSKVLQRTIVISAAIVICAVLFAVICRLFLFNGVVNTNLFGSKAETSWHYSAPVQTGMTATADEPQTADYYFVFEPDDTLKIQIGSFEYFGNYTLRRLTDDDVTDSEDGKANVGKAVVDIENTNSIDGVYYYDVSGNVFTGKTMKLTNIYSEEMAFEFDDKAASPIEIKREGEFNKDDNAVGSWTNKNEMASQTLTFNGDGTYNITTKTANSKQVENGLYSCDDGKVTLSSFYLETRSQSFKYTVDGEKLTIIQEFVMPAADGATPTTVEQPIEYTKD